MSEELEFFDNSTPPPAGDEMTAIETWIAALTKPTESTFAEIAAQRGASLGKALLWVALASLLSTFTSLVAQAFSFGKQMGTMGDILPPEIARELANLGSGAAIGIGTVICGAPVGAIFSVIGFLIGVALIQWVAKLFGGTGSFEKLAYTFAAITVPYSVVVSVLSLVGIIPIIGILTGLASFGLSIYLIVLEVLAVKAVNNLDTGKAVGSVLLPGLVAFLLICCCFVAVAMLLGPQIGEAFNQIQQGLY